MKHCPSPNGRKGVEKYQDKVKEVMESMKKRGLEPRRNYKVDTPNGEKAYRILDVAGFDEDGTLQELAQIGRHR